MRTNFLGQTDRQTDRQTEKFNTISLRFTGDNHIMLKSMCYLCANTAGHGFEHMTCCYAVEGDWH